LNHKRTLKVPLKKVAEGVSLCLENASQFCSDAKILNKESSCKHALGLCIYAMEELGKAIMLKESSDYATKNSEDFVLFERVEPGIFFHGNPEDLKNSVGFSGKPIMPFYDHLSKLFYSKYARYLATMNRIMKRVEKRGTENLSEIAQAIRQLLDQAREIDVENPNIRELAFYVDYDEEKGKWSKGSIKVTSRRLNELVSDVEEAISIVRYGKSYPYDR
jgi:hypothetical protein